MIVSFRFHNIAEVVSDSPTTAILLNESLTNESSIPVRASSTENTTMNLNDEHKVLSNETAIEINRTDDSQLESSSVSSELGTTNMSFLNDSSAKPSMTKEEESSVDDIALNRNISLTTNAALKTNRTVHSLSDSSTASFSLDSNNVTFINDSIANESTTPEQESSTDNKALSRDDENNLFSTKTLHKTDRIEDSESESIPVSTVLKDENIDGNSMISTGSIFVPSNSSIEIYEAAFSTIKSVGDTELPELLKSNTASKIARSTKSPSLSQAMVSEIIEIEVGHTIRKLESEITTDDTKPGVSVSTIISSKADDRQTERSSEQNTQGRMIRRLYFIF